MDIILVSHPRGRTWRLSIEPGRVLSWLPVAVLGGIVAAVLVSGGFAVGRLLPAHRDDVVPTAMTQSFQAELLQQREELAQAREKAEDDAHALARRIALLQAEMMRLDAAGERMTQIAHIAPGEFNFEQPPAVGGPEQPIAMQPEVMGDVIGSLDRLQKQLDDRERQMRVLEDLLLASKLQKEIKPAGWPVADGFISSGFGIRTDPFTGLRSMHPGIDFAAAAGTDVMAVASGIVDFAGPRAGYGNLIEINHGNGYVTRYGHNERLLVKVGDRVMRGQSIALMGSTGRSTGPHVHFEVLLNGNVVDPSRYLEAAR